MLYLGLDVHSKWFTLAGFDKVTGEFIKVAKVLNDPAAIKDTFAALPTPRSGVLESGTNAHAMYRLLQPYFDNLVIVAPNQVWDRRRDTGAKTDARDAYTLAEELCLGRLRFLYLPDDSLREYRTLVRGRFQTAQEITRQVNHLYALVRSWGAPVEKKLLTKGGRSWLDTLMLPEHAALVLRQELDRLDTLMGQELALDAVIGTIVKTEAICQLLLTIPCVGPLTALVLRAEIGEISRFAHAGKLISYAGLDPRVLQSGDHCRFGGLTKHGNASRNTAWQWPAQPAQAAQSSVA